MGCCARVKAKQPHRTDALTIAHPTVKTLHQRKAQFCQRIIFKKPYNCRPTSCPEHTSFFAPIADAAELNDRGTNIAINESARVGANVLVALRTVLLRRIAQAQPVPDYEDDAANDRRSSTRGPP